LDSLGINNPVQYILNITQFTPGLSNIFSLLCGAIIGISGPNGGSSGFWMYLLNFEAVFQERHA
jgi:hypothetical protein